jgi:ribonuclease HIII
VNQTLVFAVAPEQMQPLEQRLRRELPSSADWRPVAHARFSVKDGGVVLTCYHSGKLVAQGNGLADFVREHLQGLQPAGAPVAGGGSSELPFDRPTIGSDEAGKGDYFGPLVVAAVHADAVRAEELQQLGVADSKTLADRRMMPLAERIERTFDCEIRWLDPDQYNARHRVDPNVNHLLADLHAEALDALCRRHPEAVVVVDRFAAEELVATRLRQRGSIPPRLLQVPGAESHPVVAAASIVARIHFIEGLQRCAEATGTELHKGAGAPADLAARRVFQIGGLELLAKVAKLHFRNTLKIGGR